MTRPFGELRSVAEFVNGAAFKPEDWVETGARIIRIQNLTDTSKPFNRTTRVVPDKVYVRPGDILVSWSASLGVFEWNEPDTAVLNQHIFRVIPDESRIDKRYLKHGLVLALQEMQRHLHGATMQHVNRDEFLSTQMYVPPLSEQRRIAGILDRADGLRAKRRAALEQLNGLTQAMFLEMFGDPATNPKGWPTALVGDVADVQGGLQVSSARKSCPREVPYLRVANVYRGFLDLSEVKTLRATDAEIVRTTLAVNDLLIVEGHGNPAEIGRGALWNGAISGCVHQNHLIRARFHLEKLVPLYACEYLNSPVGRRHLLRAGKTTSGLNTISVSDVRAAPIALPPLSLQSEFAARVFASEKLKTTYCSSRSQLDALFSSVQHRAFGGTL